jgi:hypothetical protein
MNPEEITAQLVAIQALCLFIFKRDDAVSMAAIGKGEAGPHFTLPPAWSAGRVQQ